MQPSDHSFAHLCTHDFENVHAAVEEGRLVFTVIARLCVQKYACSQSVGPQTLVSPGSLGHLGFSSSMHTFDLFPIC